MEEKYEFIDRFIKLLSERPEIVESALEGVEKLMRILAKLNDNGILDAIDGFLEEYNSAMNATFRSDLMFMIGNLMSLLYILNKIDYSIIMKFADKIPKALKEATEELEKEHKSLGTFELLRLMKKPEMAKLIKALQAFSKNL